MTSTRSASLYTRSPRAARAASSARRWLTMAYWCRKRGDRGGAAIALRIAGSFRRHAAFVLQQEQKARPA